MVAEASDSKITYETVFWPLVGKYKVQLVEISSEQQSVS